MTITKSKMFGVVVSEQHPLLVFPLVHKICNVVGEKDLLELGEALKNNKPFNNDLTATDKQILDLYEDFSKEIRAYMEQGYKINNESGESAVLTYHHLKKTGIVDPQDIKAVVAGDKKNEHYEKYGVALTKHVIDAVSFLYYEWNTQTTKA